jgi:hypothetical protein
MHLSLQYQPTAPLTLLQLLMPETAKYLLQTADFLAGHPFVSALSFFMWGK